MPAGTAGACVAAHSSASRICSASAKRSSACRLSARRITRSRGSGTCRLTERSERQRFAYAAHRRGLGNASRQEVIQRGAQRIEIRARLRASVVLFERRIAVGSEFRRIVGSHRMQPACNTEIDQFDGIIRLQHDVRRLQIAVNDGRSTAMQVGQHIAERDTP